MTVCLFPCDTPLMFSLTRLWFVTGFRTVVVQGREN